jgi:glycosyltransferase involved in cell wall biosynthesis
MVSDQKSVKSVLMLLSNAFDPDPRVHNEAKALVEAGYNVAIICWDRDQKAPPEETIDGVKVERICVRSTHGRGAGQLAFLFLFWLKGLIRGFFRSFQIIHCHDFDTLPLGYLLAKLKRAKLVYDSHESYVDMLVNIPAALKRLIYATENLLLKRADLVITVGEILKEFLIERGAKNACVVGNWKDPDDFKFPIESLESERLRLGIAKDQTVICFIAHLTKERKLPEVIEVVAEAPDLFLLLGGGGNAQELAEQAQREHSNIRYLGFVHPKRIPFYTAMSDLVFYGFDPEVRNSKFSAPNKLFEALGAGRPILTADFGEIGRIVKERRCGALLKDYSKEELAKGFRSLRGENGKLLGANALKAGREIYSWSNAKSVLLKNYSRL